MKRRRMSTKGSHTKSNISNFDALLEKIEHIYTNKLNELPNDITLVVGGISYPANRYILCSSSDVFETMLMNSIWNESRQNVIELQEVEQCTEVFPIFLKYFYLNKILLNKTNTMPLLLLADKYNVKNLIVQCVEYMREHIADAANQGQLVTWFQFVLSLNQPATANDSYYCNIWQDTECKEFKAPWNQLFKACRSYIKWNLDLCAKCFNTFECDILVGLLKQSDLVVQDEMQLFEYVVTWLNCQSAKNLIECNDTDTNEDYMGTLTEYVMSYIRYPMILPKQMAQLLKAPVIMQNKDFFVNKMAATTEYHLIKKLSVTEPMLEYTPRLYTSKRWGNSIVLPLSSIQNYQSFKQEIKTCENLFDQEYKYLNESCWEIEMFMKGVRFDHSIWRTQHGTFKLPRVVNDTVRATIKLKLPQEVLGNVTRYVRVAIIVYGVQNKISHVITVAQKVVLFDSNQNLINIDGFMLYNAVNRPEIFADIFKFIGKNVSYFSSDKIHLKFHVIITPIIPGLTDTHVGTRIQHVHI